jgi:integrase
VAGLVVYRVVWYPAQRASGLLLRPHDFRHSFVSHMRAAGIDGMTERQCRELVALMPRPRSAGSRGTVRK